MHFVHVQGTTKGGKNRYFKYPNDFEAHPNYLEYGMLFHRYIFGFNGKFRKESYSNKAQSIRLKSIIRK